MNDTEQLEQESEKVTIRKAKRKLCLGISLGLLGLAVLWLGAFLDLQSKWGRIGLFSVFLACEIAGLVLMIKALPGAVLSDIRGIEQKYGNQELSRLQGMTKMDAVRTLRLHGFQIEDNGYYRKKQISIWMDFVTYYVKLLDSYDMGRSIQNECEYFNKQVPHGKNNCLILMLYTREPDTELLRKAGILQIADNMVRDRNAPTTVVVVGADPVTGIGQYLDVGKELNHYLYKYGCKMLKKLFG